jgi:AcrR family transcriptional regulator
LRTNWELMREKILKESINLLLHKGFRGTTIKDITNSLKLTQGVFYWYFKSKDDLLEAILEEWESTFLDGLISSDGSLRGSFLERFRHYHKYSTEFAVNHRELCVVWTTLAAEIAGSGLKAENTFRDMLQRYIGFVTGLIEMGKSERLVKQELDTNVLANVIIGMHNGILLQWYTKHDEIEGPEIARAFRDILLSGMSQDQPQ